MAQKSNDEITLMQVAIAIGSAAAVIGGSLYIILKLVGLL